MGTAIATLKIMPDSPDVDMDDLQNSVVGLITGFAGESEKKIAIEPVAFGLKSLNVTFVMNEDLGSTDKLEEDIDALEGVASVQVTDFRRALG